MTSLTSRTTLVLADVRRAVVEVEFARAAGPDEAADPDEGSTDEVGTDEDEES